MPEKSFTVCALLYGDYPDLAHRLLSSLEPLVGLVEFRLGLNKLGEQSQSLVRKFGNLPNNYGYVLDDGSTTLKYPRMRQMFYGPHPVTTPYVIWLDDDSWLNFGVCEPGEALEKLRVELQTFVLLGSPHTINLRGNQRQWIEDQPWYGGLPITDKISFCTGGGWAADMQFLRSINYPWPELQHRGGDTMLGQAVYQQQKRFGSVHRVFDGRVFFINADGTGKEDASPRRGFDQQPIGYNYTRAGAAPVAASIQTPTAPATPPQRKRILMDLEL